MKNAKKIFIVTTVILLIFVYVGCAKEPIPSQTPTPTPLPEDLLTFVIPSQIIATTGLSAEKHFESAKDDEKVFDVLLNKDGSLTYIITSEQQKIWLEWEMETLNEYIVQWKNIGKDYGKEYYIKTNDDLSEIRLGWDGEMMRKDPEIMAISLRVIQVSALLYQIFSGVDPEKCNVNIIFEHYKTGKEVYDFSSPHNNDGSFTESIWD